MPLTRVAAPRPWLRRPLRAALRFALSCALAMVLGLTEARSARAEEAAPALDWRRATLFRSACAQCHLRPGLGAPIALDAADWVQRRNKGFEALVRSTVQGLRDMPPLGTCGACTEEDFRLLVSFLSGLPVPAPPLEGMTAP